MHNSKQKEKLFWLIEINKPQYSSEWLQLSLKWVSGFLGMLMEFNMIVFFRTYV